VLGKVIGVSPLSGKIGLRIENDNDTAPTVFLKRGAVDILFAKRLHENLGAWIANFNVERSEGPINCHQ
jgi:hypothetical protein